MKTTVSLLILVLLLCWLPQVQAQSIVRVSTPRLSLKNNNLLIVYDILYHSVTEKYSVRIEISDANGRSIEARALSGDIGEHIEGGNNKTIVWDMGRDSIYLNEDVFVQVYASPEEIVVVEEPTTIEDEQPIVAGKETSFSRSSLILQSLAFPGLGLSRLNQGEPHWIRGVLGYGCIGGSIYFNRQAIKNYDAYLDSDNLNDIDDFFNKAQQQDQISEILGFVAIGIWVTDMVWTIAGTSGLKSTHSSGTPYGLSLGTRIEPMTSIPMITLICRF